MYTFFNQKGQYLKLKISDCMLCEIQNYERSIESFFTKLFIEARFGVCIKFIASVLDNNNQCMIVHFTRGLNIILVKDFENYIYILLYMLFLYYCPHEKPNMI